jgi:hypothetical protein
MSQHDTSQHDASQHDASQHDASQHDASQRDSTSLPPAHVGSLVLCALVISIITDRLISNNMLGDLVGLWILLMLVAGGLWLRLIGVMPARSAWPLIGMVAGFAVLALVRRDETSPLFSVTGGLLGGLWLAASYRDGRWMTGGLLTWSIQAALLLWSLLSGGVITIAQLLGAWRRSDQREPHGRWATLLAVLRGTVLALPVLLVFGALLGSADPRYAERLDAAWRALRLTSFEDLIGHIALIGVVLMVLIGVYRHAAIRRPYAGILPTAPSSRFLGSIESSSILGAVIVLFGSFLAVQVEYLFGGQALLEARSLRYADYARAGFDELVTVALGAIVLLIGTSIIARRDTRAEQRRFTVLFGTIAAMVLVLLGSAFQRLLLYEQAYGFTGARIAAHLLMIWLALLFVALVVLEAIGRQRTMVLACVIAAAGFAGSLGIGNVDELIVRQNVARASKIDFTHLANLSSDAVPALAELMQDPATPAPTRAALHNVLACHQARLERQGERHFSDWQAQRILDSIAPQLPRSSGYAISDGRCYPRVHD